MEKTKRSNKKKQKMKPWLKTLLTVLVAVFGVILVALIGLAIWFFIAINRNADQKALDDLHTDKNDTVIGAVTNQTNQMSAEESEEQKRLAEYFVLAGTPGEKVERKEGFYNFLVIGRDKAGLNTDVMIIASIDTKNSKATTVQIPRDSYVEDSDGNTSKINAVFARGYTAARDDLKALKKNGAGKTDEEITALCKETASGISLDDAKAYISGKGDLYALSEKYGIKKLQQVINRTFGIYFDYYAIISTDAFVRIVDAIGGVDVYVQQDMDYDDPLQNLHIHIKKGNRHLDGKTAEGFVRFRSGYVQADIARLDAQKIFMTAFFKKLLSFSSVTKVNDILTAVFDTIDTDISLQNALGFVKPALALDLGSIRMLNMQGTAYKNGMYYALNKEENLKIVNENFNIFTHDLRPAALNIVELVENHATSNTDGFTMEGIDESQPKINFITPKKEESVPAVSTPETPTVTVPDTTTETEETEEKKEVSETPDTPESEETTEPEEETEASENVTENNEVPENSAEAESEEPEEEKVVETEETETTETETTPEVKDEAETETESEETPIAA